MWYTKDFNISASEEKFDLMRRELLKSSLIYPFSSNVFLVNSDLGDYVLFLYNNRIPGYSKNYECSINIAADKKEIIDNVSSRVHDLLTNRGIEFID